MLAEYKKKTNIGIGLAIAVWVLGGFLLCVLGEDGEESINAVGGLGTIPFVYGCYCYAKGKGHHGAWGLVGLCPFGLIILICFRDKHKSAKKEPATQVRIQNETEEKEG